MVCRAPLCVYSVLVEFGTLNQSAENDFGRASLTNLEIFEDRKATVLLQWLFALWFSESYVDLIRVSVI